MDDVLSKSAVNGWGRARQRRNAARDGHDRIMARPAVLYRRSSPVSQY